MLKNSPDSMFAHIAALLRAYLGHGYVTGVLLLASLVPIIKDKLGCKSSSKNYRSIAISSLFLKVLDWLTIILFGFGS